MKIKLNCRNFNHVADLKFSFPLKYNDIKIN